MTEIDRKEQARLKQAARDQLEHRKEYKRMMSSLRSREHKVNTTQKRFEEHTMEELLRIARRKCADTGIDFTTNESDFIRILSIMHGVPIVQSGGVS